MASRNPQLELFFGGGPGSGKPSLFTGRAIKLGKSKRKQARRIYLEGLWLARSEFEAGGKITVLVNEKDKTVTLLLDPRGERTISGKTKRGKRIPVIDLELPELDRLFSSAEQLVVRPAAKRGEIVISRSDAERMREERRRARPNDMEVSLYSGAGLLSLAANMAGARTVLGIEKWDEARAAFESLHHAPTLPVGVEEVALGEAIRPGSWGMPRTPWLLTAGVPCEPYSKLGGKGIEASDPHELADQIYWTLLLILAVNPQNIVIENVPQFLRTAGGFVRALAYLGYHVYAAEIDPYAYGYVTGRTRAVLVATTDAAEPFPQPRRRGERVTEFLLPPESRLLYELPERQGGWFSVADGERKHKAWVAAGRPKDKPTGIDVSLYQWLHGLDAEGRKKESFSKPTIVEYDDDRIPAVPKSMWKGSPTGPYVHHPRKRDLYRFLTVEELRRIHGVPERAAARLPGQEDYALATQLYGQAVHVPIFTEIIERLPGGRRHKKTITAENPFPVVPLWYGYGPLFTTIPWGAIR